MVGHQEPIPDGYINNYVKCILLPPAATAVFITLEILNIGSNKITQETYLNNHDSNRLDDPSLDHFEILNGENPLFSFSDVKIDPYSPIQLPLMETTSLDNTLIFNLTVGRGSSENYAFFHAHFNGKYTLIYRL